MSNRLLICASTKTAIQQNDFINVPDITVTTDDRKTHLQQSLLNVALKYKKIKSQFPGIIAINIHRCR